MKLSFGDKISLLTILLLGVLSVGLFSLLPEQMATHWNAEGVVNGFMPKLFFVGFMIGLSVFLWVVMTLLPQLDPLHPNIQLFERSFDYFKMSFFLFWAYAYTLTLTYNLVGPFNFIQLLAPALALLLFSIGVLLAHAKQNWFIGIRTPWTLSSEKVWNRTQEVGSKLFKGSAVLAAIGAFFPTIAFWLIFIPVIVSAIGCVAYSYWLFQQEKRKPKKH